MIEMTQGGRRWWTLGRAEGQSSSLWFCWMLAGGEGFVGPKQKDFPIVTVKRNQAGKNVLALHLCVRWHVHTTICMWKSENNLQELILLLCGLGGFDPIDRLGSRYFDLLSHFTSF